jgi:hypothetical protein
MDEFDVGMEQRLRNVVVDWQSGAPDRLIDFVDTVPASHRRAGRVELALERPRVRRSIFALATAAAVVVAVASSAVLVSYRHGSAAASPTPAGIVRDGWAWQATDGTLFLAESEVPHGFVATCGRESGQEFVDPTLCSSPDGLHWSDPPDPTVVSVAGTDPFLPQQIFVRDGVYLSTSSRGSGEFFGPGRTLWRSTDGVHWAQVDTSASPGPMAEVNLMAVAPDGFMADVMVSSGTEMGIFVSSDGIAWSKASDLPFDTASAGVGYYLGPTMTAGLYAVGLSAGGVVGPTWRTTNGRDWHVATLPAGYSQLSSVVTLPDGSLRGVASTFEGSVPSVIVDSADGLTWRIDPTGPTGSVETFVVVGDRMVVYVGSTSTTGPYKVLQSDDWGKSWRPLLDLSGKPVVGSIGMLGGRLEIRDTDMATHWLLTPVQESAATPAPSPSPAESQSVSPMLDPSPSVVESDSPTPSAEPSASLAPSATPNVGCGSPPSGAGSVALIPDLEGVAGWTAAYEAWGDSAGQCDSALGPLSRHTAIVLQCTSMNTIHVDVQAAASATADWTTVGSFDVPCQPGPDNVFQGTYDTLQTPVGANVRLLVTASPGGAYEILVQTADWLGPTPAPASS